MELLEQRLAALDEFVAHIEEVLSALALLPDWEFPSSRVLHPSLRLEKS